MIINRVWAMPSKDTFSIPCIREIVERHCSSFKNSVDMFSNGKRYASVTNDIDPSLDADFHMDALDFLKTRKDGEFDLVLHDPPFSPRQLAECYKKLGRSVNYETTQASFWSNIKKEIGRVTHRGSVVITCGWNSGGVGKKYGFEIAEILLVAHGGQHNDTIVTIELRIND